MYKDKDSLIHYHQKRAAFFAKLAENVNWPDEARQDWLRFQSWHSQRIHELQEVVEFNPKLEWENSYKNIVDEGECMEKHVETIKKIFIDEHESQNEQH